MGYLHLFVSINVMVFLYSVQTVKLECNVDAVVWNNELKLSFEKSAFWTTMYLYDYEYEEPLPMLYGFIRGLVLTRTLFKLNNGNALLYGLYINDRFRGTDLNDASSLKCEFVVDEKNVIFQYDPFYEENIIKWNKEKEEYDTVVGSHFEATEDITFALVHEEQNGVFRIFQTCDGKSAWVQIADHVLKHYWNNQFQTADFVTDMENPSEIAELELIIEEKLNILGIHGLRHDILGRYIKRFDKLSRQFPLVNLAAIFLNLA